MTGRDDEMWERYLDAHDLQEDGVTPRPFAAGYCLSGCRVGFESEARADAHYNMTGHAIGWPVEDVDWPSATDDQVMGRA